MQELGIGELAKRAGVGALLKLSAQRNVAQVKRSAQTKLQRVRNGLAELIAKCPGHGHSEDCPILRALGAEESR